MVRIECYVTGKEWYTTLFVVWFQLSLKTVDTYTYL